MFKHRKRQAKKHKNPVDWVTIGGETVFILKLWLSHCHYAGQDCALRGYSSKAICETTACFLNCLLHCLEDRMKFMATAQINWECEFICHVNNKYSHSHYGKWAFMPIQQYFCYHWSHFNTGQIFFFSFFEKNINVLKAPSCLFHPSGFALSCDAYEYCIL